MIERRPWHWVDWMLLSVQTGWFLVGAIYAVFDQAVFGQVPVWAALTLMLLGIIGTLAFWRPGYVNLTWVPLILLVTVGTLQTLIVWTSGRTVGIIFVPLILIGFLAHRRTMWWTIPVFVFAVPLSSWFLFHAYKGAIYALEDLLNYVMFFGIGFALGRLYRTQVKTGRLLEENQRQYSLIRQQNQVLEQYASRIEALTLQAERNRMAQELHDTVGHTFTSVIMGMDAVSYLIEAAPDKAKEQLEKLRSVTRSGLEEVRRSIHQMAPQEDDLIVSEQFSRLANEFAMQTGTVIRVEVKGKEYELPQQARWTLFRCLQESLTNAKRHGHASVVTIILEFGAKYVELSIEDNGIGSDTLESGFGLTAMRDRLEALTGTLHVRSKSGEGTCVRCRIPMSV
ncbi:sensor histidine kinase [Paenibacillus chartarius]|uniref:histidine kinase n=1 Tax=Paenibacillus chartarius TaxID=747481 RepID=A0ABV6DKY1_9BACL